MKLLIFMKPTIWGNIIRKFIEENFSDNLVLTGDWGEKLPKSIFNWEGDYIISFLSPWILPREILERAKRAAINFHPAPPKYPGIGGYNFAIYDAVKNYGVMCHHMAEKVDSGEIIAVKKFPIYGNETVVTLKEKTMVYLTELFYDIMDLILKNEELPQSSEHWHRAAYTRKEFQELCKLKLDMPEEELLKRLKATYFPGALDYPNINIGGRKYLLVDSEEINKLRNKT